MKKLRVGIFGINRGSDNYASIKENNAEIVALCDKNTKLFDKAKKEIGDVPMFTDFDEFINQDMDVLYLANYFPEHTPYAVKALEKNINVICECIPCSTMAECVALVEAAEKSNAVYMLAENYPYMLFNQEMQKVYQGGTLGKILYAEGEYNHPVKPTDTSFIARYYDSDKHWRNYLPATYYLTHSLGPLMMATHSNPIRVTAMPVFAPKPDYAYTASRVGDNAAIVTCLNDDNSVYKFVGCSHFGAHGNSYRLACEKGQIENLRGTDGEVMLRYNDWDIPEGMEEINRYTPKHNPEDAEMAERAGHDGSDYYMFKDYFDCLRTGRKPYLDVYVAVRMASVGILAHRSLLEKGVPYDIPDFHNKGDREKFRDDTLSPFYYSDGSVPTLPCCSVRDYRPSDYMIEKFNENIGKNW